MSVSHHQNDQRTRRTFTFPLALLTLSLLLAACPEAQKPPIQVTPPPPTQTPFGKTPAAIPGRIQAEDFDRGGLGVAYSKDTPRSFANPYREDSSIEIGTAPGGFAVLNATPGEWLEYTVNIAAAGQYDFGVRLSSAQSGSRVLLELDGQTSVLAGFDVAGANGWQTVITSALTLPAGAHRLRLKVDRDPDISGSSPIHLDWFELTPYAPVTATPFGGQAWAVPGVIQAEDFDDGGSGLGYQDSDSKNTGGQYRSGGVDIASLTDGYTVTDIRSNEWLAYTISVTSTDEYNLRLRYAASGDAGQISVLVDGQPRSGPLEVASTNAAWDTLEASGIGLSAGQHSLRLRFDAVTAGSTLKLDSLELVKRVPTPPQPSSGAGTWSGVFDWPNDMVPTHAALMPDGDVLTWGGGNEAQGSSPYLLWNANTGQFKFPPNSNPYPFTNLFCAGFSHLPDGRLLLAGGHILSDYGVKHTNIFDSSNDTMTRVQDMAGGRWYPSTMPMPNGDILVAEGSNTAANDPMRTPEIWQTNQGGGWKHLSTASLDIAHYYPYLYPIPGGKVVRLGPEDDLHVLDTAGTGSWTRLGDRDGQNREYGSSVIYRPGKALLMGGGGGQVGGPLPTKTAVTVDITQIPPQVQSTGSMNVGRRQIGATLLPNGEVFISGGSRGTGNNDETQFELSGEIWNPDTGTFRQTAPMALGRGYHHVALLLPDATVLVAGGGNYGGAVFNRDNGEIYRPPYLYKPDGSLAPRPSISTAPASIGYGQNFVVKASSPDGNAISRVTMLKLGTMTHARNFDQNFHDLTISARAGNTLTLTAPSIREWATPGHYLMFALNAAGVPSTAKIVKLQ